MEQLYLEVIKRIRAYINKRRGSKEEGVGINFLENVIKRLEYIENEENADLIELKYTLANELKKYTKKIFKDSNNNEVQKSNMIRNIEEMKWLNSKYKINRGSRKYIVRQGGLYYAELGKNIGREQNGKRPVVILQNNKGNRYSDTTIIAPVTTHQCDECDYDHEKHRYYVEYIKEDNERKKYLDFYEVPLKLQNQDGIYGFVNIAQIRIIDRKRICDRQLGIATKECMIDIKEAMDRNFNLDMG